MGGEKTIASTGEIGHRHFAKGRKHGIVQTLIFWFTLVLVHIVSEEFEIIPARFVFVALFLSAALLCILFIPIYLFLEKRACDGIRDGNYPKGYVFGNLVAFIVLMIFLYSPLSEVIFFWNSGVIAVTLAYFLYFFLPSYIIGILLPLIICAIVKHIETKKSVNIP